MTRTWLITGSSRGFGRAVAEAALRAGDNVVTTARHDSQLGGLQDIGADRVRLVPLDVTDAGTSRTAAATAVGEFGRLDVVVNNAGYANSALAVPLAHRACPDTDQVQGSAVNHVPSGTSA
jgi:NAD(P)-dependent dehydrogenase (short-subunit alcohol dehydrogenase family)